MKYKFFTHKFLPVISAFLFVVFCLFTNISYANYLPKHSISTLKTDLPKLYQDMIGCGHDYPSHLLLINTKDYYYLLACSKDLEVKNNSLYISPSEAFFYIWRISSNYSSYDTMVAIRVNSELYINSDTYPFLANYEYMDDNYSIKLFRL